MAVFLQPPLSSVPKLESAVASWPLRGRHGGGGPRMCAAPDPLTAVAGLLWGRSLPPQALVAAVRTAWSAAWHLMMRQLAPSARSGTYSRPPSAFPSVSDEYYALPLESLRLHLYVGLPCPWAHRTIIVRALRSLESLIPVSIASPGADGSWDFTDGGGGGAGGGGLVPGADRAGGRRTLREIYGSRRGGYEGRSTVPMLWDSAKGEVVCNESYGIVEFLNSIPGGGPDLSPPELRVRIEQWNQIIYPNVNNGVYRCGFSQSQEAYDSAAEKLFETLELLEAHLAVSRYLCGNALTLADVCLFTTLIRFDLVYNVLFRCTRKKLLEYPNLHGYTRDIYQGLQFAIDDDDECRCYLVWNWMCLFSLIPASSIISGSGEEEAEGDPPPAASISSRIWSETNYEFSDESQCGISKIGDMTP